MSSKYPNTSVIDIAMGVLSNMDPIRDSVAAPVRSSTPIAESKEVSDFVPDVTDTNVSDDYIASILEGTMGVSIEKKNKKPIKEQQKKTSKKINEDKVNDLIQRLSSLLAEAKQMINEMTTVGMIGTNTLGGKSKKKVNKHGYLLSYRRIKNRKS